MSDRLDLPDVPAGENPFRVALRSLGQVLFTTPSNGFEARLAVLWALMAYVIVVAALHLVCVAVDYRRRGKTFWVWRLVSRSNGQYIVGKYVFNFLLPLRSQAGAQADVGGWHARVYRSVNMTLVLREYVDRAYFWRTLVWLPILVHGWISSWANLQAAVLSSQRAANNHVLSPRLANGLYIGVLIIFVVPLIVLPVYSAFAWVKFWDMALRLRDILVNGMRTFDDTGVTDYGQLALASRQRVSATEQLDFFIKFNTRRFSSSVRTGSRGVISDFGPDTAQQASNNARPSMSGSVASSQPTSASGMHDRRVSTTSTSSGLGRKVFFANVGSNAAAAANGNITEETEDEAAACEEVTHGHGSSHDEKDVSNEKDDAALHSNGPENGLTIKELKQTACESAPGAVHMREQAKQILALRKVQWDLIVFVVAVVSLATMFMGVAIWRAVSASNPRRTWASVECAFFLIPWGYLVGMCFANTSLVYNALRHLSRPSNRKSVTSVGVNGAANGAGVSGSRNVARDHQIPPDSVTGFSSLSDETFSSEDVCRSGERGRSASFAAGAARAAEASRLQHQKQQQQHHQSIASSIPHGTFDLTRAPAIMISSGDEGDRTNAKISSSEGKKQKCSPKKSQKRRTSMDDQPAVEFTQPFASGTDGVERISRPNPDEGLNNERNKSKFLLLSGPNHNLFGKRDPKQYGTTTLAEIEQRVTKLGKELGVEVVCAQTNWEGEMIDLIHYSRCLGGVIMNPGAFAHYSYALHDAIDACGVPVIEVHISNV
ncbi:hypothetical protein OIV83_004777 [Microbotryomycetes sp. JL201]|nr:hypothetical protein OIV83_004777 [Microbotryomycetes sp. JL201]